MKFTLCVTLACNVSCSYCYIKHRELHISDETAKQAVDFIFATTPPGDRIEIAFFGGEPLLSLDSVDKIIRMIHEHHAYAAYDIEMTLITNTILLTEKSIGKLIDWGVHIGASCDGPPKIQDMFRRFPDGSETSVIVEKNLKLLVSMAPDSMVNAVYRPETVSYLPETIDYFSSLGLRRIYVSPDYSAPWTIQDAASLAETYRSVGKKYCDYYRSHDPHYISLINSKILAVLQDGYGELEKCRMGTGELTISPQGNLFPCERLVGDGTETKHCLGTLDTGPLLERMSCYHSPEDTNNRKCAECELQQYCMHWCGCSNYFATGFYDQVSEFLCFSERAALQTAMDVLEELGDSVRL